MKQTQQGTCYENTTRNFSCHMVVMKVNAQKEESDEGVKV